MQEKRKILTQVSPRAVGMEAVAPVRQCQGGVGWKERPTEAPLHPLRNMAMPYGTKADSPLNRPKENESRGSMCSLFF